MAQFQEICLAQSVQKYGYSNYDKVAISLQRHPLLSENEASSWSAEQCKEAFNTLIKKEEIAIDVDAGNLETQDLVSLVRKLHARYITKLKQEIKIGEEEYGRILSSSKSVPQSELEVPSSTQDSTKEKSPSISTTQKQSPTPIHEEKPPEDVVDEIAVNFDANAADVSIKNEDVNEVPVSKAARGSRTRSSTLNTMVSTDTSMNDEAVVDQLVKRKPGRPSRRNTIRNEDKSPTPSVSADDNEAAVSLKRFQNAMGPVVSNIASHRYASVFLNPVSKKDAPNYGDVVKLPMDLKTIKMQLKSGEITSVSLFHRAVLLMLSNAVMYNPESSEVAKMAGEVFEHAEVRLPYQVCLF